MTNLLRSMLLVAAGTLALLLGPLRAQETAPAPAAETAGPASSESAASESADRESAPRESAAPPAEEGVLDPGEGLSADNSLSFPVDI